MRRSARRSHAPFIWVTLLAAAAGAGFWYGRPYLAHLTQFATPAPTIGTIRVETDPAGASVELEGKLRGLTPLTLTLAPGAHNLSVSHDGQSQAIAATVTAGGETVHHIRWAAQAPVVPEPVVTTLVKGRLQIISDPAGAMVTVDGASRGTAPLTLDEIEPGEHQVVVQHMGRTQRRTVVVQSGSTASLVISNPAAGTESGWLSARSTTPLQIFEDGRLIGTTDTDRIMLSTGTHTLEFIAEPLGFKAKRTVSIATGQTTTAAVSLPQAPMNLNAVPWAEVWIDGKSLGQTPIAGLMQPIGSHVVEFRHPELGTKQATVMVSLAQPARVAVDMRAR